MLPASEQETLIEDEVISGDSGGEVDGEEDREEVAAAVVTVPGSNLRSKKRSMTNARNEASESLVQSQFPLSRVKKIIKADRDVNLVSSDAVYFASIATVIQPHSLNL